MVINHNLLLFSSRMPTLKANSHDIVEVTISKNCILLRRLQTYDFSLSPNIDRIFKNAQSINWNLFPFQNARRPNRQDSALLLSILGGRSNRWMKTLG